MKETLSQQPQPSPSPSPSRAIPSVQGALACERPYHSSPAPAPAFKEPLAWRLIKETGLFMRSSIHECHPPHGDRMDATGCFDGTVISPYNTVLY